MNACVSIISFPLIPIFISSLAVSGILKIAGHLRTLVMARAAGYRAVMLYVIQRTDVEIFAPAMHIDPVYAREMALAQSAGVEIIPVQVTVSPTEISYLRTLPFVME